jgi:glycosyltransferase involved in cell wall biosynthesis
MRIAIDARDAEATGLRGWGRYASELLRALEAGGEVDVVRLRTGWPGVPEAAWEQLGLARAARRAGADVLHVPNCFLPLRRALPGVVTIHDLAWERFPDDFAALTRRKFATITPRAARSAEAVITPSRCTAADVIERYGVDPARVHVIPEAPALPTRGQTPPGFGDLTRDSRVNRGQTPYLLGVGDLRAKKNWRRLAQAWRASGVEHRLVIAGVDSGEGAALRELGVELPGYLGDAELDALLRGADALVHPSLWEGFGLVVVEAQARGVPVVAARGSSLTEAGGDAAVYVDPLDVDGIAAGILEALDRREELAAAGRAHAATFSWERAARETVAVYRSVAR